MKLVDNSAKTNWKYVIIVVFVALFIGGGVLWYAWSFKPMSESIVLQIPTPQPKEQFDISAWQTYRNEDLGFEVKYPEKWEAEESSEEIIIKNPTSESTFSIIQNPNPKNLSMDDWFREATIVNGRPTVKAAAKLTTINGVNAYRFYTELEPPNPLFEVFIKGNNKKIFTLFADSQTPSDSKILDQILSTFRFVKNIAIPITAQVGGKTVTVSIRVPFPDYIDEKSIKSFSFDSNGDGNSEIILIALQSLDTIKKEDRHPLEYHTEKDGYFLAITLLDERGNYRTLGDLVYHGTFAQTPTLKGIQDIDDDTQDEIIVDLQRIGATGGKIEGILNIDFLRQKLDWVKFRDKEGKVKDASFFIRDGATYARWYSIEDVDQDGRKELIDFSVDYPYYLVEPTGCTVKAYEWDGSIFSYNEEVSQIRYAQIGDSCGKEHFRG